MRAHLDRVASPARRRQIDALYIVDPIGHAAGARPAASKGVTAVQRAVWSDDLQVQVIHQGSAGIGQGGIVAPNERELYRALRRATAILEDGLLARAQGLLLIGKLATQRHGGRHIENPPALIIVGYGAGLGKRRRVLPADVARRLDQRRLEQRSAGLGVPALLVGLTNQSQSAGYLRRAHAGATQVHIVAAQVLGQPLVGRRIVGATGAHGGDPGAGRNDMRQQAPTRNRAAPAERRHTRGPSVAHGIVRERRRVKVAGKAQAIGSINIVGQQVGTTILGSAHRDDVLGRSRRQDGTIVHKAIVVIIAPLVAHGKDDARVAMLPHEAVGLLALGGIDALPNIVGAPRIVVDAGAPVIGLVIQLAEVGRDASQHIAVLITLAMPRQAKATILLQRLERQRGAIGHAAIAPLRAIAIARHTARHMRAMARVLIAGAVIVQGIHQILIVQVRHGPGIDMRQAIVNVAMDVADHLGIVATGIQAGIGDVDDLPSAIQPDVPGLVSASLLPGDVVKDAGHAQRADPRYTRQSTEGGQPVAGNLDGQGVSVLANQQRPELRQGSQQLVGRRPIEIQAHGLPPARAQFRAERISRIIGPHPQDTREPGEGHNLRAIHCHLVGEFGDVAHNLDASLGESRPPFGQDGAAIL